MLLVSIIKHGENLIKKMKGKGDRTTALYNSQTGANLYNYKLVKLHNTDTTTCSKSTGSYFQKKRKYNSSTITGSELHEIR